MTEVSLAEVYELLAREAHLLDDRDYEGWLQLFAEDCLYWMPVDPLSEDGTLRLNVFYDDRPKMEDRIARLTSGNAYTEEPISLTARTFSALQLEPSEDGRAVVRSNFQMVAYRSGEQRVYGGWYRHRLVRQDDRLLIAEKCVTLLGSDAPQPAMTFLF
ncbi:MAG TPA: aromatic-ring-hydroxylating dioxygenase subunit beta [Solirubrobacterales bacterium]|nr:aromatic-ring-hydroxylating dioxygenase subunit beta [Solirubrobacterales bacterium]